MKQADRILDVIQIQEREINRLREVVRRYQLAVEAHEEACNLGRVVIQVPEMEGRL